MFYYKLNNRSLICFEGKDVIPFLQGLTTNDVAKIKKNRAIYSTLLSPQGKIIADFFLFQVGSKIYLDTAKESLKTVEEKLNLYKLNQNIEISKKNFSSYFLFFGKSTNKTLGLILKEGFFKSKNGVMIFNDPRKKLMGYRIICINKNDEKEIKKIINEKKINKNYDEYEKLRILNCIPDVKKDELFNNGYLLQYNFDKINAICWKKGCFIGQEITSKMKYKGSVKKKLYTIKSLTGNFNRKVDIKIGNEIIGRLSSFHKNIGLGLLKVEKTKKIKKKGNILII